MVSSQTTYEELKLLSMESRSLLIHSSQTTYEELKLVS